MFGFKRKIRLLNQTPEQEDGRILINNEEVAYTIERKARRRRSIALYVESSGSLRFVVPLRTRTLTIQKILHNRSEWIARRLHDLKNSTAPKFPKTFQDGDVAYYFGEPYHLKIIFNANLAEGCQLEGQQMIVNLPHSSNLSAARLKEDTRLEILLWYKKQAKLILKERLDFWAQQLGVHYNSLRIVSPLRQWGSCTAHNDIRLNWRVIIGPLAVIDYLVAHELCHIVHKDHSRRFWDLLGRVMPDHKKRRKLLRTMDASAAL